MEPDNEFSQWTALLTRALRENEGDASLVDQPTPPTPGVQYLGITPGAGELLRAVDAGGVPAFVTNHLKQLAADNGIDVLLEWTPNEIVAAIRERATTDIEATLPPPR